MGAKPGYRPNPPWSGAARDHGRLRDTGQVTCFDARGVIDCGRAQALGVPGQDGMVLNADAAYRLPGDGTVVDPMTGLTWQRGHNPRLTYPEAERACADLTLGGRDDWRLPTIKELFSISHWQGVTGQRFFIDSGVFELEAPGPEVLENDRFAATHSPEMMGQTWSATAYGGTIMNSRLRHAFFFNFLDGRIKAAPMAGRGAALFYRCVRGPVWGENRFTVHGDGTVSDGLSGLMWQQADDGRRRDWPAALRYCDGLTLGGHDDWRLPNVKELHSLVDTRWRRPALDTSVLAQSDPDGWFWSSTTHGDQPDFAAYVCFGPCTSVEGVDVHGAGAQRSDPKTGDPARFGARGGQRDATRVLNHARCVRTP